MAKRFTARPRVGGRRTVVMAVVRRRWRRCGPRPCTVGPWPTPYGRAGHAHPLVGGGWSTGDATDWDLYSSTQHARHGPAEGAWEAGRLAGRSHSGAPSPRRPRAVERIGITSTPGLGMWPSDNGVCGCMVCTTLFQTRWSNTSTLVHTFVPDLVKSPSQPPCSAPILFVPPSLFGDCPYRYPLRASREARLIAESQFTPAPGLRRLAGAGFLDGQSMSSGAIEHGMFVCPHSTVLGGGCILQGSATFFLLPLPPHDTTCTFVRPIARPAATYGCSWVVR